VLHEEFGRAGSGGVSAAMMAHNIALPPIVALADAALKDRVVADIISGRKLAALCITEPGAGSDVARLSTRADRDGDHYIVNGTKTFITGGLNADYYTVAVRTGGAGMGGLSLLLIERDAPGFSRARLDKMGWHASDTATLYFDDCRVPASNLIGEENAGFHGIMMNFNAERFGIAAMAYGFAKCAYDEALDYARQRQTFGQPILKHQVIRHKLIDMATKLHALKANLDALAWQINQGGYPVAETCMLKNLATETLTFCAGEAVQIFGGAGYMRGAKVERIYRETKVLAIGGGTEEIVKDLAARQLGW
jgi:acyl-CoA dehydrogenase